MGKGRASDRGSAVVEFVLVAPLVMLIFAGVAQVAIAGYVRSTLIACAAEGARAGAEFDADKSIAMRRTTEALKDSVAGGSVTGIEVARQRESGVPVVAVTITARLPLIGLLGPSTMRVTGHSLSEIDSVSTGAAA